MKLLILAGCLLAAATVNVSAQTPGRPGSIGITGDTANVNTRVKGGVALIGGGGDVDNAYRWMINRSGGGDVVVLRATGPDSYHTYIGQLGKVNSVETLLINSREMANNDTVAYIIRNAEMLFISGGDQSNYMRYWRGTKTAAAINYLLNVKKVPVGGTSAGCAVLSGFYYSGENGSAVSAGALADPYDSLVTVYNNDFLQPPFLHRVITDQHYLKRGREGRHIAFMSRIIAGWKVFPQGIAPDERTAVCIDEKGMATIIGESKASFIFTFPDKEPEQCTAGKPLTWSHGHQALKVYQIQGSAAGNGSFDVKHFDAATAKGGSWYWWWVENGQLYKSPVQP